MAFWVDGSETVCCFFFLSILMGFENPANSGS